MTPEQLAAEFRALLLETIGPDNYARVLGANKIEPEVCASHEYCDANEVMNEAFRKLSGGQDLDPQNPEHRTLYHAAWILK